MLLRLRNSFASMTDMVQRQEQTANNLANAGTVGYRRDRSFTHTLDQYIDAEQAPQSIRETRQFADMKQGAIEKTGNPLDVAIEGDGFFALQDELSGQARYTRAGRFVMDAEGRLRTPAGHLVEGQDGPLALPPDTADIHIAQDGTVKGDGVEVGRLRLVRFDDPLALRRTDGAAFDAAGQAPAEVETPEVRQGFIEQSNVDPVREMTNMIMAHRAFETQQKSLQTTDQILGRVANELGKF